MVVFVTLTVTALAEAAGASVSVRLATRSDSVEMSQSSFFSSRSRHDLLMTLFVWVKRSGFDWCGKEESGFGLLITIVAKKMNVFRDARCWIQSVIAVQWSRKGGGLWH